MSAVTVSGISFMIKHKNLDLSRLIQGGFQMLWVEIFLVCFLFDSSIIKELKVTIMPLLFKIHMNLKRSNMVNSPNPTLKHSLEFGSGKSYELHHPYFSSWTIIQKGFKVILGVFYTVACSSANRPGGT